MKNIIMLTLFLMCSNLYAETNYDSLKLMVESSRGNSEDLLKYLQSGKSETNLDKDIYYLSTDYVNGQIDAYLNVMNCIHLLEDYP